MHHDVRSAHLHHQHQHLSSQLAAAVSFLDSSSSAGGGDEVARAAAVGSLHRVILRAGFSPVVRQSSLRLCQTLEKLTLEKAFPIRQAAAIAYGALGAMSTGVHSSNNAQPGAEDASGPADLFMAWALPRLTEASFGSEPAVLALAGLREFLAAGDATAAERFVPSILKACQELLENEMPLLEPLLGVLTVCGSRFSRCLEPYFPDVVDLLLGWALDPEHPEGDCRLIVDSFLKFQPMWAQSPQFSINLLTTFLGHMEILAHDHTPPNVQQLHRLLALASCFVAVMQATALGLKDASLADTPMTPSESGQHLDRIDHMAGAAKEMLPRILPCFVTLGQKFWDFRWLNEACRCLTLFAEVLKEDFADFYPCVPEILFQGLEVDVGPLGRQQPFASVGLTLAPATAALTALQVQVLLQVNMRIIACQGHKVPVEAVAKLLGWPSPFASLRLHPSRIVRGTVAATYLLLLHHGSEEVAAEASRCLMGELEGFKNRGSQQSLSECEARSLFRFDLMVLLCRAFLKEAAVLGSPQGDKSYELPFIGKWAEPLVPRLMELKCFVLVKLNPFQDPLQWHPKLQLVLWQALHWHCSQAPQDRELLSDKNEGPITEAPNAPGIHRAMDCSLVVALALDSHATLPMKLEALGWISIFVFSKSAGRFGATDPQSDHRSDEGLITKLSSRLLTMAFDKEPRVKAGVAVVLELLLQTNMVEPSQLQPVVLVALKQLKDPEPSVQAAYQRVAWAYAPAALWMHGWVRAAPTTNAHDSHNGRVRVPRRRQKVLESGQHLRLQQLSWILNYLSQRSQVLPLHWLQRMIHNFPGKGKSSGTPHVREGEEPESMPDGRVDALEGECCSGETELLEDWTWNVVSVLWWAVQEASRHCVTVRLRTHLGGPTQTFAALERMLVDVPHLCRIDFGRREVASGAMASPTSVQLLPLRLLLEFVEALKKDIYNAYEGSVVLPPAPTLSALFFRANRKVCEEWFVRIREAFINASVATQCHAGTYLHAAVHLQDLRATSPSLRESRSENNLTIRGNIQGDLSKAMQHASLALCRAHEADALVGLKVWVKSAFAPAVVDDYLPTPKTSLSIGPFAWLDGLTFQARGQYEKAVAQYNNILQLDEVLAMMGADGIQFTIARAVESFVALADWESLDLWVQELQLLRAKHAGKAYCGALTTSGNDMNAIYALARFDVGDTNAAWAFLDLTPQSRSEMTADPWQALHRSEQMLLQAMLQRNTKSEKTATEIWVARAMIEDGCQVAMLDGLTQAAPFLVQLDCIQVYDAFRNTEKLEELFAKSVWPFGWPLDHMHQDCQLWLKLLRVYRATARGTPRTLQLHQQLVRLARKQSNLRLARRLLEEVLSSHSITQQPSLSGLSSRFEYEGILLLHAEEKQEDAVLGLCQFVEEKISASVKSTTQIVDMDLTSAKACLKLAAWLRASHRQPSSSSVLSKLGFEVDSNNADALLFEYKDTVRAEVFSSLDITLQQSVGAAIKAATRLSPGMAKAWFSYGYWCFNYAGGSHCGTRAMASGASRAFVELLDEELRAKEGDLTDEEVASISLIVSKVVVEDDLESCVQQIVAVFKAAAASAGSEDIDGEPPSFLLSVQLQRQLQMMSSVWSVAPLIPELMRIWWALRRRQVTLFLYSARGFLQYLALSNQRQLRGGLSEPVKPEKEDGTLSASLYLLQILANYGVELENALQQGLSSVPPSSWQAITAQILARLSSHPESRVRKQLQGLLMASVNSSPWAIVYPLLVDMNGNDREVSEELKDLRNCLVNLHPKLARDVKSMVAELGAITVFWDEQWLSTLQDLRTDVMRRITALKHEAARVAENATLSHSEKARINAAKYLAMMAPVVVALERRLTSTSRPPESPRQTWFQEQFGSALKAAIETFKAPSASLSDVWCPFDAITADLVSHQKTPAILLSDVSPGLAVLQSSEAPMPGLKVHPSIVNRGPPNTSSKTADSLPEIITVASFSAHVMVLSTKTKPKKLQIVGSNGSLYPYLLKGREDLRLDARIMQLLQAVNAMLHRRCETRRRGLTVRHYSVTPISGRAGLVQWIDNLTSMYSVYKAWQERTLAAAPGSVPRPSDLFYGKIIPALKEKGLRKVISRRDWPQDVKRNVLLELIKETPRQLLHNELWCASEGLSAFRAKLDQFSGSVAVISIVGYILGLGDRHLDNILVDFSSGDVVHIDYNVCFDKGLRLKIPEIVPFRLTHTIEAALGLTGVEGVFRTNCEAVLGVLQSNKEVLLMLLQVFIWDPLVEWMRGDGHDEAVIGGEERKGMELAVSLSLFASRLQENRVPLQEHHDQLLMTLPAAAFALESLVEADDRFEQSVAAYTQAEQSRRAAVHAEGAAMSLFVEATSDLDKAQEAFSAQARELESAKALTIDAARELVQWVKQRASVLDVLRSGPVPELEAVGRPAGGPADVLSLKAAALTAGVPLAVVLETAQVRSQEVDQEVTRLMAVRQEALLHAVQSLQAYSAALQRLVPVNYVSGSHVHSWAEVLQVLSQELSPDVLAVARRRAADLIAQSHGTQDESVQQKYSELRSHFEHVVRELQKLKGDLTDLEAVIDPEAVLKAKEGFLATVAGHFQFLTKDGPSQEAEEKQRKYMSVVQKAAADIYKENCEDLKTAHRRFVQQSGTNDEVQGDSMDEKRRLEDLKAMIEKCVLVSAVMSELETIAVTLKLGYPGWTNLPVATAGLPQWALRATACVAGVREFCKQMVGAVFPEAIDAAVSRDPGVAEAFGAFAHIREAVDRTLQPGESRSLDTVEQRFNLLVDIHQDLDSHIVRGKVLLAALAQLFSGLENLDQGLTSLLTEGAGAHYVDVVSDADPEESNLWYAEPGNVWRDPRLSHEKAFFVWKVRVIDGLLDLCIRDASGILDPGSSSEQVLQLKKRLRGRLLWYLGQYLGYRLMPMVLQFVKETRLSKGSTSFLHQTGARESFEHQEEWNSEEGSAERALKLLREYFSVHETVRAGSAASAALRSQAEELMLALDKVHMEAAQMEWLNELVLSSSLHQNQLIGVPKSMRGDKQGSDVAWWNRQQVYKNLYAASTRIKQAIEGLQNWEIASLAAEGDLERAMAAWACSSTSLPAAVQISGIPPEFHEHLHRRRQLLRSSHEQAVSILRLCEAVLEFEASRDGFLSTSPGDGHDSSKERGRIWQQTYFDVVSRLEATYFAFTSHKTEWQSAVVRMESARVDLSKVANELQSASSDAESALGVVKVSIANLKAQMKEATARVLAVSNIVRSRTSLTLDAGQMLEEVLAITEGAEGADDVHGLAQEASAEHAWLMAKLSKVNELILPLEPLLARLSSPGSPLTDAMVERNPGHLRNVLDQSHLSLTETSETLSAIVPSLLAAVKNLHSCLSKLIRTASSDAGFLHKALVGVGGENQQETSPKAAITAAPVSHEEFAALSSFTRTGHDLETGFLAKDEALFVHAPDQYWISPPDSGGHSDGFIDDGFVIDAASLCPPDAGDASLEPSRSGSPATPVRSQRNGSEAWSDRVSSAMADTISRRMKMAGAEHLPLSTPTSTAETAPQGHFPKGKNMYAVSVLKRVQMKLEGQEVDGSRQHSIAEQVDSLLRQATGIDNLANMYEGWTPWV